MPPKVYGEFSIELEPHYHLIQKLPSDGNVFAASLLTSEKVLSFPDNEEEERFRFTDIHCYNGVVPTDFAKAIPETVFSGYDLSVPYMAKTDLQNIHIDLHDRDKTKRSIGIRPGLGDDDTQDLLINDNYPNRSPRSAKTVGREAIRNFLAWQLHASGSESVAFELSSEQKLAMLLGQHAKGQRHTIRTAQTPLGDNRVLHAEKEEVFDKDSKTGDPVRTTHSIWLTALLSDETLQLGTNFKARTVARLDASNLWHPGNSLSFEVEANVTSEEDATELTKQIMMMQRVKKLQTARAFAATISQYLQAARD